jgi:hypothetical protein
MPFSASHTRHVRLGKCFFFGGSTSSSESTSTSRARFSKSFLILDMVAVVDAEEERKVSKFKVYKAVADVEVISDHASVKEV